MPGVPRSPDEERKYQYEGNNDKGERSAAERASPILIIPHAELPLDIGRERSCPRDGSRAGCQAAGRTAAVFTDLPSLTRSSPANATAKAVVIASQRVARMRAR
jgi:hypothetical protein